MIDEHEVREMLQRRADTVPAPPADTTTVVRRARRRLVLNGAVATVAAAAIAAPSSSICLLTRIRRPSTCAPSPRDAVKSSCRIGS